MTELRQLTAAEQARRIEGGELSAKECFDAWAEAAAGDELNAYRWKTESGRQKAGGNGRLRGVPIAVKDIFCTEGIPTTAGSRILEGFVPT